MTHRPSEPAPLTALQEIVGTDTVQLELGELLDVTLKRACHVLDVDTAMIMLHQPRSGGLTALAAVGLEDQVNQAARIPVGSGFAGRVAAQREPVVIDSVDPSSGTNAMWWDRGLHTMLGVPMVVHSELIGVLLLGSLRQRRFTSADIELVQLLADQLAFTVQFQVLRQNQAAAVALQRSLMPGNLPGIPGLKFAARYSSGAGIGLGGDWYDLFKLPGDRLGIVMGDVSGNGLDAAVIMGHLRSALRAYALDCEDPAEVLDKLDRKATHFEHGAMATVAYGVLDADHHRLRLSLAGHLPPVVASPGQPGALVPAPADPPVGMTIGTPIRRTTVVELEPDAVLAFYTDGLVERRGQLTDVGMQRLAELIEVEDPERLCSRVMSSLIGSQPAQDDVALLIIRRAAGEG